MHGDALLVQSPRIDDLPDVNRLGLRSVFGQGLALPATGEKIE